MRVLVPFVLVASLLASASGLAQPAAPDVEVSGPVTASATSSAACPSPYVCVETTGGVPGATAVPANPPSGAFGIAIGSNANSTGHGAVAIGASTNATGDSSTAVGVTAQSTGYASSAFGDNANATAYWATALGAGSVASSFGSTATGTGAAATGSQATAIGLAAKASADNSTALGAGAKASGTNSVALGAGSVADQDDTVSIGDDGSDGRAPFTRRLTGLSDGIAPTDGVNVQQLQYGLAQTLKQANLYTDQRFGLLNTRINQAGAAASALGLVAATAAGNPSGNRLAMGFSNYNGQSGVALAYQHIFATRHPINFTLGASFSGGERAVGAAASIGF